ncbi:hypothetical protein ACHAWF_002453 [Thalassiosira exigua]
MPALRRLLAVWALGALVVSRVFSSIAIDVRGASASAGASPSSSSAAVVYNDTRPPSPNGYLCVRGAKGRLNNLVLQNLVAIHMAHRLNRTLLVDAEVSRWYDVDRLSLGLHPNSSYPYRVAVPIKGSGLTCGDPRKVSPYAIDHSLNIPGRYKQYGARTKRAKVASVDNNDIWYWLGRPPEAVYERFFRNLVPRRRYAEKVEFWLREKGLVTGRTEEGQTYNAVHLRRFEGNCGDADVDLCCPKLDYVQQIIIERGGSVMDPLFVASDRQCPPGVLATYRNVDKNNTANNSTANGPVIYSKGYEGACVGVECAVIDFELCVRAGGVFVGNLKSSGDMNIREARLARYGLGHGSEVPGTSSVLSRRGEVAAMERKHRYMTRYIVGHWRFRPDCDKVNPSARGKPCV